ncbi:hypothetical protein M5689_007315 [Euphorbia peplus]|nr:hypothetical protein M5689_007315 [Euphorbia peplus]
MAGLDDEELSSSMAEQSTAIQDLRLRLPPPDISQRLPHLLAHSLASNAALALQLNAHSTTKEQAQLREVTLQEENVAYEKAISNCENKIQEKVQETDMLKRKLQEMEDAEKILRQELENVESELESSQSGRYDDLDVPGKGLEAESDTQAAKSTLSEKLEDKKKELSSMEEVVHDLEKKWAEVQDAALKKMD